MIDSTSGRLEFPTVVRSGLLEFGLFGLVKFCFCSLRFFFWLLASGDLWFLQCWEEAHTVCLHDATLPPFPLRILATLFSVLVRRWDSSAPFGVLLDNNNICLLQAI